MITYDTLLCFSMICSSTVVVFASSKGPINYLKVFVNNKKIEKPMEISTIKRMVSTNPAIEADQGTPTRMTFRDVYMYEATDKNGNNHMTTDGFGSNYVPRNYDKRIVGDDKTVSRLPVDDALVQRMCLDIASAVHRQISEQTMGAAVCGTTASGTVSGTAAHRKSEQQQKKQQQQKQHQQQKQEQQQQKQLLQQKKQQQHREQQQQLQLKKQQQHKEQQQQKEQQQHHKQQYKQQQQQQHRQQPQQKPQKRRRHSYQKASLRPVRYKERKESVGIVTIGPDDRYNDPTVTQEISRTDYQTSVGVVEEDVDDNRQDEDADQSPKVWEVNMVDDQVIINSAKSREQREEAFTAVAAAAATASASDYDDCNQTS